jgi:membrane protein implicated in regulation of membrane protease activity
MQPLIELWTFATAWYNLPFTLALLAFLGLSALQFIGLGGDQDADLDHDLDMDHELDLDHDLDMDHDLDLDHEADLDHDLGQAVGHPVESMAGGAWTETLQFLGVGHAPLTMILLVWVGGFGFLGWITNSLLLSQVSTYPGWVLIVVLAGTLLVSAWLTSRTARLIGRTIPTFASTATSASQLVSRRGRVASSQIDDTYGQVKVRDSGGTLITVFAKVDPGNPPIPRDSEVYLVDYDPSKKVYIVVPSD